MCVRAMSEEFTGVDSPESPEERVGDGPLINIPGQLHVLVEKALNTIGRSGNSWNPIVLQWDAYSLNRDALFFGRGLIWKTVR